MFRQNPTFVRRRVRFSRISSTTIFIGLILVFITLTWYCMSYLREHQAPFLRVASNIPESIVPKSFHPRTKECTETSPCTFRLVADPDEHSRQEDKPGSFVTYLIEGEYSRKRGLFKGPEEHKITWKTTHKLKGTISDHGRGLELSELILGPDNSLLSVDDRTGIIYEHHLVNHQEIIAPKYIVAEGHGVSPKGAKLEWATTKDNKLWIGGYGREYTDQSGTTIHKNNFWVTAISTTGHFSRYDWTPVYNKIREVLKVPFPGYVVHEAVHWSSIHKKWFFLPRRVSALPYDEVLDEERGSNVMLTCDQHMQTFNVITVGEIEPRRGFSSLKFIPGTSDQLIMALKTEEDNEAQTQKTYVTIFTINGEILLPDEAVPYASKFEGLEFVSIVR